MSEMALAHTVAHCLVVNDLNSGAELPICWMLVPFSAFLSLYDVV